MADFLQCNTLNQAHPVAVLIGVFLQFSVHVDFFLFSMKLKEDLGIRARISKYLKMCAKPEANTVKTASFMLSFCLSRDAITISRNRGRMFPFIVWLIHNLPVSRHLSSHCAETENALQTFKKLDLNETPYFLSSHYV